MTLAFAPINTVTETQSTAAAGIGSNHKASDRTSRGTQTPQDN
jgi:hypothetical protein